MAKKVITKKTTKKPPALNKQGDVPASQAQLEAVRAELKSDNTSLRLEMNAKFKGVESQLEQLKFLITDVASSVHSVKAIVEEQNARNKFVIDGYKAVIDVQEVQSQEIARLKKLSFGDSEV